MKAKKKFKKGKTILYNERTAGRITITDIRDIIRQITQYWSVEAVRLLADDN